MKIIIRIVAAILLLVSGFATAFYFWAQQPNRSATEHVLLRTDSLRAGVGREEVDTVFSIMTYNIGYLSGMTNNEPVKRDESLFSANLQQAVGLLGHLKPDIVCLQEIDYGSVRSYLVDQEAELADTIYPFVARAVNWDKRYVPFPYWPPSVHFGKVLSGQSVLSKFPVTEHLVDTLAQVASVPFYYRAFYLHRLAQVVKVVIHDKEVMVINVHLEAFDRDTRERHTKAVLRLYRRYSAQYPTVMVGDFNSSPDEENPTIETILREGLRTVDLRDMSTIPYTYSSGTPSSRLDYIFYNEALERVDGGVVTEAGQISDHLPVRAVFRFKAQSE
ncbi:endonuclease/exonuclease/phosphatase family metal-dependent hydrolase [Sphingobacterium allocomposti]|uniref:Endonuclease/exonuclease/phosphatase family metal-dependent hydrolase n=1 Tax=Sphingobacterium allocomposti TaxID=415956 RepID=A0A5S5DLR7_9SPHI|nr:endonuclease/exonuclease/phosphatase family protein [Sphingobacterium composti Yoo et al. 2007 non Ten et al. 2007]TYP96318.1 endonuclease/exonuclease/phosphatase family metal-dependent hydrolase [Sphingobacterium composti Yoo et al. 2007 non Ten et al. 2007]